MKLIAVTTGEQEEKYLIQTIASIIPYLDAVILREKQMTEQDYSLFIQRVLAQGVPEEKLIIHGHTTLPGETNVKTLHLSEKRIQEVHDLRKQSPGLQVGVSTHSNEVAKRAEQLGATYILYGHVFSTASKKGVKPKGVEKLAAVAKEVSIPVYAIGGITSAKVTDIYQAKASGIAVMSGVFSQNNPLQAVQSFRKEVNRYEETR
ncbi:thiamine phosphate synthase [Agaribacter marinus]|uniref:Thiamine phosphate synthase n=1 Tax=Virgibacillus salarius TaxID=447199 RepID=A0A941DUH9_9BACI|nr:MULTISPECIES: thiamine phosphate synthase [Bacillaceae]MBR7795727.1 thiamine phosphate synthase [Virgibacillus salarius]MDY7043230.1 thiamine phosphate synthase [Virgibacillus sp. M23]NAZ08440.1 thiamine phosphate synthase [Agaribacter marinus]